MKNEKHPIDDLFQRGLNQHAVPSPMHVWERIEDSRGRRHRNKLVVMRQKFTILSSAAAVLLLGVWLGWSETPELGSFPLLGGGSAIAELQPKLTDTDRKLELPAQQAGILPDVKAIIKKQKTNKKAISPATEPLLLAQRAITPSATTKKGITVPAPEFDVLTESQEKFDAEPAILTPVKEENFAFAALPVLEEGSVRDIPTKLNILEAKPLPVPETGCARFSEGRPAIFLAVTAGPSLLSRKYASRSDEYFDYATQRANSEMTHLSYGANARLSIVFPWGGALRTGIGYTQFNEELEHRISNIRQVTTTLIYGPNNNVIGADTIISYKDTVFRFNNHHRMIDIPIQVGYEVRYNKVTLAANAGVNINVAYSSEGNYLEPVDLLPTRFDNDNPDLEPVYKTRIGMSYQASLGLHYQLNDRLDFMAEPYLRYYPGSFTRDDYPLSQKYLVGGVGLGLRMLL